MGNSYSITYKGFDFDFNYDYEVYEEQTYEYPGSIGYYNIYNITLNGINASELLEYQIDEFIDEAIENLKNR